MKKAFVGLLAGLLLDVLFDNAEIRMHTQKLCQHSIFRTFRLACLFERSCTRNNRRLRKINNEQILCIHSEYLLRGLGRDPLLPFKLSMALLLCVFAFLNLWLYYIRSTLPHNGRVCEFARMDFSRRDDAKMMKDVQSCFWMMEDIQRCSKM